MTKAVPQYPRPVPAISTDEAPICSNTVVYEHWTDEAEREELKRAAKRRRTIAEAAASYLRGEPLFILTASLQGPFGDGWKNPWARKRQKRGNGAELAAETAAVESVGRERARPATAGAATAAAAAAAAAIEHPLPPPPEKRVPIDQAVQRQNQNLSTAKRRIHSPSASASRPDSSAEKVSDWLRKTEDLPPSTAEDGQSSPTPGAKERLRPLSRSEYGSAVAWRRDEAPAAQSALGQPFSFSGPCQSAGSEDESPLRAEAAIIEYKKMCGRRVPPSTHQLEFEYCRPRRKATKADEAIPDANDRKEPSELIDIPRGPSSLHHPGAVAVTAAQGEQSKTATTEDHSTSKPALTNESSNIHSAQVMAAAPRLATLPSDAHSTEEMLQSAPLVTPNERHTPSTSQAAAQQSVNTCDSEKENDPAAEARSKPDQLPAQADDEPTNSLERTPVRELDTPEMSAAIKPIDLSTAKKKPLKEQTAASPTSSPRATKDATMLSQRGKKKTKTQSVKASMKVTKPSTTTSFTINKADSAASAAKKLTFVADLDSRSLHSPGATRVETTAASAAAVAAPRGKTSNPSPPTKSILKRASASASASISAKPEAQPVFAEHALENGGRGGGGGGGDENNDSFDLDLAMDELGSYLGTWDADVEAQKLLQ